MWLLQLLHILTSFAWRRNDFHKPQYTANKLKLYVYLNGFNGPLCVDCRGLRSGRHLDDDDIVPELAHIHPRERPDWEETISAMVRHMLGHRLIRVFSSLHFHIWWSTWSYWLSWCCTSLINAVWFITHPNVTSETLAHIVSADNFLWGLYQSIYPSSTPVPNGLFHRSPGDIIPISFPPAFGLDGPCILPQQHSENEVVSMVTCGANNGRRAVWFRFEMLPSITQHREKETIMSAD